MSTNPGNTVSCGSDYTIADGPKGTQKCFLRSFSLCGRNFVEVPKVAKFPIQKTLNSYV
jgi:hypothetical protein